MEKQSSVLRPAEYRVEMDLPIQYRLALQDIGKASEELGIPYAVVGSLALAAYSGKTWDVQSGRLFPSDIDLFVLADDEKVHQFEGRVSESLRERKGEEIPRVDFAANFRIVGFHLTKPYLRYEGKKQYLDVDPQVFIPIEVDLGKVVVPVLHPQTHLYMVSELTSFQRYALSLDPEMNEKVGSFTDELRSVVLENKMGFQELDDSEFRVYRRFIRSFKTKYS